jgi:MYXO-CTERM domain-containing protein
MATKNRTSHKPSELIYTPVPSLAIAGQPDMLGGQAEVKSFAPVPSASAAPGDGSAEGKKGCGCRVPSGSPRGGSLPVVAALAALAVAWRRRKR